MHTIPISLHMILCFLLHASPTFVAITERYKKETIFFERNRFQFFFTLWTEMHENEPFGIFSRICTSALAMDEFPSRDSSETVAVAFSPEYNFFCTLTYLSSQASYMETRELPFRRFNEFFSKWYGRMNPTRELATIFWPSTLDLEGVYVKADIEDLCFHSCFLIWMPFF